MKQLKNFLLLHESQIFFIDHLLSDPTLATFCQQLRKRIVILTDQNLVEFSERLKTYLKNFANLYVEIISIPAGEPSKTREMKSWIEDQLLSKAYGKDTCLISLGGGVITDLGGFVAATYCRGVSSIYIPTSFLGMVDASIGGKTAVNTSHAKNSIGLIYPPLAIFIDTKFLESLAFIELQQGLIETLKHSLIADADLFLFLQTSSLQKLLTSSMLNELVRRSFQVKQKIVAQDLHEKNIRHSLNFGHTIGHAIEALSDYQIKHGDAVAMGVLVESYLSHLLGYLSLQDFERIEKIVMAWQIPLHPKMFEDISLFKEFLLRDKKNREKKICCVLLKKIGEVLEKEGEYTIPIPEKILDEALKWASVVQDKT